MRSSLKIPILILSVILLFSQINNVYGACDVSVTNCKTCKDDDNKKCTECNPKFVVIGDACTACGSDCDACTSNTVCTTCTAPKQLQSDKSCAAGCKPKEFFDTDKNICTSCHTSCASCTKAGECDLCPANQFKDATSKLCVDKCIDGQFNSSTTDCAACSNGCKTCEKAGECKTCPDKFFLNGTACSGCKTECAKCQNGDDCDSCVSGQFLQQDSKTCKTTCDAKFFKNSTTNKCDSCHTSCETCTKAGECDLCPTGKFKDATSKQCVDKCVDGQFNSSATDCATCSNGCKTCQKAGECNSCLEKFFLNVTTCSACKTGCATCVNGDDCKTCTEGLFLQSDNKTCSANCPDKFFKNSTTNNCEPCHSSCGTCSKSGECDTCPENSFFLNNKPSLCDTCLPGCRNCSSKTVCDTCQDGFFSSEENKTVCTRKCVDNSDVCEVCDKDFLAVCKVCQPGYALSGGLCTNCQPMTGSTRLTNSATETKYKCRACMTENCKTCQVSEGSTTLTVADLCSECIDGYFYDGSSKSCIKCQSPCATCKTSASDCQSCIPPTHVLITLGKCDVYNCTEQQYFDSTKKTCETCKVTNCLVCDKFNGQACLTCTGSLIFNQKTKACEEPVEIKSATCNQGAYLGFDGKCVCTGENQYYVEGVGCRIIDITSCGSCYISSRDVCTPYSFNMQCNKGCLVQTTETATACTQCKQLVILETQENNKLLRMSTPQFLDSNGKCQSCKEGCGVCSSLDSCTQCLPNFMMIKEKDGTVQCTKPTSQASLCTEGLLPSMASVYYLNADNSNQQIKLAELFDKEKQQNAFFDTDPNNIAFAIGVYGQPLITGNEEDEKLRLYTFNETTKKLTFSFVSSDVAERQETDLEITIECLPCLYNCKNKCDKNYYYDSNTGRCYRNCPEGYISNNVACEKITTQKPVIIKSTEIGQNGQFINSKGIIAEAVIQEFSNETFSNYNWTIAPVSAVFSSQLTSANTILGTVEPRTQRTFVVAKEKLLAGVTYKLEVTFSASSGTYKGSRLITPLPDAATISFESQGFPVNLIKISATSLESGSEFEFSYTLSEIRVFQNTPWWFIVHADGIATQVSQFSNEIFKIKAPSVAADTTTDVIFDITDGRVTYRTIRQILVKGSSSSKTNVKNEFQALKGTNTTVYTNEESFSQLPRLLKNLKKIALRTSSSEANLMARIQATEFLTEGSCLTTTHCGGDPCQRVDPQSQDNLRMQCVCSAANQGDFCQLVLTEATDYVPIVSDILIKIGNYLNQTGNARPNITDYPQFLVYLEVLMNSIDFVDEKSLLAYAFILERAQSMAKSFNDISAISIFYKRAYNYYWNKIAEFEKMEDKSISSQIEATLYNIARISIIQNAKWSINFQTTSQAAKIGSIFDGSIVYFDTFLESKKGNTTKKTFTDISFEYSFDMFKEAQVAGLFTATVDEKLFKNVKGVQNISTTLYKISMIDLTSDTPEEIKKTNVTNGVKITFSNLPLISDTKRACAFYDDKEGKFVFDVEGNQGCVFSIPNKMEGNSTVPDNTKAECICNHNTIFGLSEYKARTTKRQDMNDSSRLTFTLSLIFMILFFTTF